MPVISNYLTLEWCNSGRGRKIAQPAITAAGAARSALRAGCKDVPLETVERYNLLKHFVGMLPQNSQAVLESSVLARHHVEYHNPAVMQQVLSQVRLLPVLPCCYALQTCEHATYSMCLHQQALY